MDSLVGELEGTDLMSGQWLETTRAYGVAHTSPILTPYPPRFFVEWGVRPIPAARAASQGFT